MPLDLPALIMKRIRQLGFMRVALIPEGADDAERGRIMHLFRNRAELKKAYGTVQDELQRMRDRIKQQEGATARVQEMLQALEERLSAPVSGYPAITVPAGRVSGLPVGLSFMGRAWSEPRLLGLAYAFEQVRSLR